MLFFILCVENVTTERIKEKEVVRRNLTDNEGKLQSQAEKIRELTNLVHELTTKNKHQESQILLLNSTNSELLATHKKEIDRLEDKIREMNVQFTDQGNLYHKIKTENNSMKIAITNLTQSLEGQRLSYENLKNQLAEVYKEQHMKETMEVPNTPYVPKGTSNLAMKNSSTRNKKDIYNGKYAIYSLI